LAAARGLSGQADTTEHLRLTIPDTVIEDGTANNGVAPGSPGIEPRWTSSAKSGIGTALDGRSRVWFAVSHGIVDEVYYPRVDQANTRDLELLVTAPGFFSEEKRHTRSEIQLLAPGVPGYRLVNTCVQGRYRIVKAVVTDPERDVLVQHIRFEALAGGIDSFRLFVLLAPHIGNQGYGNDGWWGDYKGIPMLFAQRGETALALASSPPWRTMSCGYVGASDGWQQISRHGHLTPTYKEARNGNIALTGEVDLSECATRRVGDAEREGVEFVVALAFGRTASEAGQNARMTLTSSFASIERAFVDAWSRFHAEAKDTPRLAGPQGELELYQTSIAILAAHEDKRAPGGIIASLSIPWGQSKGDHEMGGYHLVWPRDLVEAAGALLASGHTSLARRALRYLMSTQEADGHWPQNMWLDGTPYWPGVQMDETAFPVLFADMLRRAGELDGLDPWPMVRRAAAYLIWAGPVTPQDRWEEDGGYSPFTLAVEIAALLAAADFADLASEHAAATYLRETADAWNEGIERWTYVAGTALARATGVDGYYARIAPSDAANAADPGAGYVPIKNRPPAESSARYDALVSPDALALVRFGLRDALDPRIVNTVRVIDAVVKGETRTGPTWYRYNGDGYGEHDDGSAFDGTGVGRGWPLLAGERGHYELAAGRPDVARRLLGVMRAQASDGGMLPEQVWDAADIPERELFNGRPGGAAMPLVWAHAEYIKLARSVSDGSVFDTPPQTVDRYVRRAQRAAVAVWALHYRTRVMPPCRVLRIQARARVMVHWSHDGWRTVADAPGRQTGLGVWAADLDTATLPAGTSVRFTLYWPDENRWQGEDYEVVIANPRGEA
jgi:glucoamylase